MNEDGFIAYPRDPTKMEAIRTEPSLLSPQDIERWAAFLPTVRVGGALPVTFRLDGSYVVVEMIVPYVAPPPQPSTDPYKIPLAVAEGFPVPVSGRYRLPDFSPTTAAHFLRQIVLTLYQHEIDEQFHIGAMRPFEPEH